MKTIAPGSIAVIFTSRLRGEDLVSGEDLAGYAAASDEMAELASRQPGYIGHESARGPDGFGITISYWTDEVAAKGWTEHRRHLEIRKIGRERWYAQTAVVVTRVERSYLGRTTANRGQ